MKAGPKRFDSVRGTLILSNWWSRILDVSPSLLLFNDEKETLSFER